MCLHVEFVHVDVCDCVFMCVFKYSVIYFCGCWFNPGVCSYWTHLTHVQGMEKEEKGEKERGRDREMEEGRERERFFLEE